MQIISDSVFWAKNLNIILNICLDNGYCKNVFSRIVSTVHAKSVPNNQGRDPGNPINKKEKIFFSLNFLPDISYQLKKILENEKIGIALKPNNTLKKLFNLKDPIEFAEKAEIIYKINCLGDNNQCQVCYIGKTIRNITDRIKEHERSVANSKTSTALAVHAKETRHVFDFNNCELLYQDSSRFRLEFAEMIAIKNIEKQPATTKTTFRALVLCMRIF